MIFTLYYMAATWLQSWKLKSIYSIIYKKFIENSSFVFYNLNEQKKDELTFTPISSELCLNYNQARISDLVWHDNLQRGFTVSPIQKININSWITFSICPSFIPFYFHNDLIYNFNETNLINLLLEIEMDKIYATEYGIEIEQFGLPIAWKIDSHLSVVLKTDLNRFCNLVNLSFLQKFNVINDGLNLIRVQTVDIEGSPQPYEQIIIHARNLSLTRRRADINCWEKHLDGLKNMSILAYQATEYELNKQKTEVTKNNVNVTPDLIPSNKIETSLTKLIKTPEASTKQLTDNSKSINLDLSQVAAQSTSNNNNLPEIVSVERKKSPISLTENLKQIASTSKHDLDASKAEIEKKIEIPTKIELCSVPTIKPEEEKLKVQSESNDVAVKTLITTTSTDKIDAPQKAKVASQKTTTSVVATNSSEKESDKKPAKVVQTLPPKSPKSLDKKLMKNEKKPEKDKKPLTNELKPKLDKKTDKPIIKPQKSDEKVKSEKKQQDGKSKSFIKKLENTMKLERNSSVPKQSKSEKLKKDFISDKKSDDFIKSEIASIASSSSSTSPSAAVLPQINIKNEKIQSNVDKLPSTSATAAVVSSSKSMPKTINKNNQKPPIVINNNNTTESRPKLKRTKGNSTECKPPNILVYSESHVTRDNVISTLQYVLEKDKYTIYPLTQAQIDAHIWFENATLLVVCGNVALSTGKLLLDFFLKGGKLLCLCSDLLHVVLPTYQTAEVRENELVRFSYNKWRNVKMMHHIFCYQPSPVKKHFSHDSDEVYTTAAPTSQSMMYPRSVDVKDLQGVLHYLNVQVLGVEETWNTPSLMLASNIKSGGRAIFSQVHLETDPTQYESDVTKFSVLQENEKSRLEILADILNSSLGISANVQDILHPQYTCGYFLGRHDFKFDLLEQIKPKLNLDNSLDNGKLSIKFIGRNENAPNATSNFLPIMLYSCPDDFSTVDYYDNLKSEKVGRLLFYTPILKTSTNVLSNLKFVHGLAVIPRQQTQGSGRSQNQWLSPKGCLMFSLQLHIPLKSNLGSRISLIQHLVATAVVQAILNQEGCQNLDVGLKWPNDILVNGTTKIGGLIIDSIIEDGMVICNIGCGINFSNSNPTICILDLINERNRSHDENIPIPSYEKILAGIFTEIELLYNKIQIDDIKYLYDLYYKLWLHSDAEIKIIDKKGQKKNSKIIGIDDFGYLLVQQDGQLQETVHPDGNSFDMLHGLIIQK